MKKKCLMGLLLLLNTSAVSAQIINFMYPNQANVNQTITTTVTGQGYFFTSNPPNTLNTYLRSTDYTVKYPNWVQVIDDDHFYANWSFTTADTIGCYNLYYEYPVNWTWQVQCALILTDTCRIVPLPANANACQGDSVKLSFMTAATYQWKLNGGNINGANQQTYYAKVSGSYTVVVTGCNCPVPTNPLNVSINSIPTVAITPSSTQKICPDESMQLITNSGTFYYQWKRNGVNIPFATMNAINVNESGSYNVIIANKITGCYNTSSATQVNVSSLPTTVFTKQPGPAGGKDAIIYSQLPDSNLSDGWELNALAWPTGGPPIISRSLFRFDLSDIPPGSDIYSAELSLYFDSASTSGNGHHAGANSGVLQRILASWNEKTVTWNNQPTVSTYDSISVPASYNLQWYVLDYTDINVLSMVRQWVDSPSTNYGFMLRLQAESPDRALLFCSSDFPKSARRPKLVLRYAPISIAASSDTICNGDSTQLSIGTTGFNYQWKKNGNAISGATGISCQAKTTGNYTVKLTNNFGCSTISPVKPITVNPIPNAVVNATGPTTFCSGDSVILTTNNSINFTYQWKKNNGNISGATSRKYTAKTAGNYKVKITNAYGCTDLSAVTTVTVPCRNEENPTEDSFSLMAFPNPSAGEFSLAFENAGSAEITVSIYDHLGRLVNETISESQTGMTIHVPGPGLYRALIRQDKASRYITLVCTSQ